MQLQAGYFIEELLPELEAGARRAGAARADCRALLRELSWFEVEGQKPQAFALAKPDYGSQQNTQAAILTVAANLLQRGVPTRAPLQLAAAALAEGWPIAPDWLGKTGEELLNTLDTYGSLHFSLPKTVDPDRWADLLWRAAHPIDPRLDAAHLQAAVQRWRASQTLDSEKEREFATDTLSAFGGGTFLSQLLAPQADLTNLLRFCADEQERERRQSGAAAGDFLAQAVDFALPLLYATPAGTRGLILEVDGPHHREVGQQRKDGNRDNAAQLAGWRSVRLPVEAWHEAAERLTPVRQLVEQEPYLKTIRENYYDSLLATENGRRAVQLVLGPLAVARVQRVLLEALLNGTLGMHKAKLKLAVVERDIPCGQQAVALLLELLGRLYALLDKAWPLPSIELHVFPAAEFAQPVQLVYAATKLMEPGIEPHVSDGYDLLLDVSMLQRPGFTRVANLPGTCCLTVRTAHRAARPRRLRSAPLLAYPALVQYDPTRETYEAVTAVQQTRCAVVEMLVQDIFRKRGLRAGQLPIISRGLQGKSVLGLLPTGGGKSLTFQLAALLQPGVAMVIVPIKSLMQDQFEGLARNWIDAAAYLNSSVTERAVKEHRLRRLREGELLLLYVSPERLVIKEDFRDHLDRMRAAKRVGFSYCVIDEAHCVSEWGHDFRIPYLKLGDNARRFCGPYLDQDAQGQPLFVPLYGLTATASFDVLADVQRELRLDADESAVVRTATMARPGLHVRVLPAEVPATSSRNVVAAAKHALLSQVLSEVPAALLALDQQPFFKPDESDRLPQDRLPPLAALTPWDAGTFFATDSRTGLHQQAGLIFCPHRKGELGVLNRYAALQKEGPPLAVGYFMGTDDGQGIVQEGPAGEMQRMQTEFVAGRLNLMVATKAFGMGIDKPNVRFTVHYGFPGSIESFVQEAGRAGRDRAVALNYLLYHPADDREVQQFFLDRSFRAREHEELVLRELLTEVSFTTSSCRRLTEALAGSFPGFSIVAEFNTRPAGQTPTVIYLNGPGLRSYGFITIGDPEHPVITVATDRPAASAENAQQLLEAARAFLLYELPGVRPPGWPKP